MSTMFKKALSDNKILNITKFKCQQLSDVVKQKSDLAYLLLYKSLKDTTGWSDMIFSLSANLRRTFLVTKKILSIKIITCMIVQARRKLREKLIHKGDLRNIRCLT